ncbi:MAG: hypothetical protein CMN04_00525 [Roseibacillus sp.]|nr:hypothetical protein [Roseibacillus sp.]|tara:strand:- start:45 stop:653 length:609 start_codon:yes stop_codon:yes gene_type:complete
MVIMNGKEIEQPPSMSPDDIEPGRLRVFGVCHIVFGGLGLMNVVGGVSMQFFQRLWTFTPPNGPDKLQEIQNEMYRDLTAYTWVTITMSLIVGVLILRAGIALTKRRQSSLRLSNIYVLSSLIAKIVAVVLFLVVAMPVIGEAVTAMLEESSAALPGWVGGLQVFIAVIGVISFLLSTIYPLCAFLMLNKPQVKAYLARHGR